MKNPDSEYFFEQQIKIFEDVKKDIQETLNKQLHIERQKKEQIEKEFIDNFRFKDRLKLEDKLAKIQPNIIETNLIAEKLNRKIKFQLHLSYYYFDMDNLNQYEEKKKKYRIKIQVENQELGYHYFWDLQKFSNRYFMIKEIFDEFTITNQIPDFSQDLDPFWDPPFHERVGESHLKLMSLAYLMANKNTLQLVGDEGKCGTMEVAIMPCHESGEEILEDDPIFDELDFVDDQNVLIGKDLYFKIEITDCQLPKKRRLYP